MKKLGFISNFFRSIYIQPFWKISSRNIHAAKVLQIEIFFFFSITLPYKSTLHSSWNKSFIRITSISAERQATLEKSFERLWKSKKKKINKRIIWSEKNLLKKPDARNKKVWKAGGSVESSWAFGNQKKFLHAPKKISGAFNPLAEKKQKVKSGAESGFQQLRTQFRKWHRSWR